MATTVTRRKVGEQNKAALAGTVRAIGSHSPDWVASIEGDLRTVIGTTDGVAAAVDAAEADANLSPQGVATMITTAASAALTRLSDFEGKKVATLRARIAS